MDNKLLNIQGKTQSLEKTLNKAYIDAIKRHIELLEEKKRRIERIIEKGCITTQYANGVIQGLDYAIEQLYGDINQLKDK